MFGADEVQCGFCGAWIEPNVVEQLMFVPVACPFCMMPPSEEENPFAAVNQGEDQGGN